MPCFLKRVIRNHSTHFLILRGRGTASIMRFSLEDPNLESALSHQAPFLPNLHLAEHQLHVTIPRTS